MFQKLRNSYHNASEWAHHHSAVIIFGLTLLAAIFGRQFGGQFVDNVTRASSPQHDRCQSNSGSIAIPVSECNFLADVYNQTNGDAWTNIWDTQWFTSTDIESRQSIGLEGGNNVTRFEWLRDNINTDQTLDFSPLTQLTYLDLSNATVGGLYIADNTLLNALFLSNISGITSIDLSPFSNLAYFHWNHWGNGSLLQSSPDFSNNIGLVDVSLQGQGLSSLDLSSQTQLTSINIGRNNLDENTLSLAATPILSQLTINNNNFTSFDVAAYAELNTLSAQNNSLTSLDITNNSNIQSINLAENNITSFDVGSNTGIYYINFQNNGLQTLTNFGNIQGFNEGYGLDDNMNGNCLDALTLDPTTISLLDTYFMNWGNNQTCGVFSCSMVQDIPESECEMLVTLYEELDGDNWDDNTGWLQGGNICGNWNGVGCTYDFGTPHVEALGLYSNNLSGTVPDLSDLPYLQRLHMSTWEWEQMYNLNIDLSNLTNLSLTELTIANTNLTGTLEDLSNSYGTLQSLYLNGNDAQEFYYTPTQLGNFPELREVNMSNLIIEGDIAPLANLANLEMLSLNCRKSSDYCDAYGDLSAVGGLTNLVDLKLDSIGYLGSGTNSLLSDIQNLTNLERLALGGNELEGELGSWIGDFEQLTYLELDNNMLSGPLPTELSQLTQLEMLCLDENSFSGSLPELVGFNSLIELKLQRNNFIGTIPTTRGNLSTLEQIGLGGRSFDNDMLLEGTLPDWSNLSNLSRIEIIFTNLEGVLPAYRGDLPLDDIRVFYNKFTGPIPNSWQQLSNIDEIRLWLNNNHLEGPVPSWIMDLDYDEPLKIESNCLDISSVLSGSQLEQDIDEETNGLRRYQTNCLSDVTISKRLGQDTVNAGDVIDLYIDYTNIGSQKAINVDIAEVLDPSLSIVEAGSDPYTFGNIRYSYFNNDDMCYTDLMYESSGPYYDHIDGILAGYNDIDGLDSVVYILSEGLFGFNLDDIRNITQDQSLSAGGAAVVFFCGFVYGSMDPSGFVNTYDTLANICLPNSFAIEGREFKSQGCGYSTEQGYIWNVGDIAAGASGTIHIKLQVADPLLPEQQLGLRTYLEMDGVNASTNELSFAIEGSQVVVLDDTEEGGEDGDDSGDESEPDPTDPTPPITTNPISSGPGPSNNPPVIEQDDCSNYIPPIDQSSSYYDGNCEPDDENDEEEEAEHESANEDEILDLEKVIPSTSEIIEEMKKLSPDTIASTEEVKAYMFAKYVGITTKDSFEETDPQGVILRGDFAKMIVNFAENILGYTAIESRREMCSKYTDSNLVAGTDLEEFIVRVCMHRIMGLDTDAFTPMESFNPFEVMNRAMIVTTISRMIDQGKTAELYEPNENYRTAHMASLLEKGVITVADPTLIDKRINAFIMLMRQTQDMMEDK